MDPNISDVYLQNILVNKLMAGCRLSLGLCTQIIIWKNINSQGMSLHKSYDNLFFTAWQL